MPNKINLFNESDINTLKNISKNNIHTNLSYNPFLETSQNEIDNMILNSNLISKDLIK